MPIRRLHSALFRSIVLPGMICSALWAQEVQFQNDDLKANILQVADHYAESGDFKNAILQYYEFLYRFPDDSLVPAVKIRLASVYQESGNFKLAEQHLQEAIEKYPQTKYNLEVRLRLALLYYQWQKYDQALEYARRQPEEPFRLVEIYCNVRKGDISEADTLVARFNTRGYSTEIIPEYKNLRCSKAHLDWPRRYGAYALSALWPGTGRILVGEYKEGILTSIGFYGLLKVAICALKNQPSFYYYSATGTLIYYGLSMYATHDAVQRYQERIMCRNLLRLMDVYRLSDQLRLFKPY